MSSPEERAIRFLYERYSEPLSLADIAKSAILSRFHFCRTFRDATGVTPGRFLSAIRIYQAKRLLLNTRMNVTEIAFAVGYNSLGSFSNHFTDSVGIAPGRFRRISRSEGLELPRPQRSSSAPQATVTGTIVFPRGYACGRVYLGAFDTPIVQRQPAAAGIIEAPVAAVPCSFELAGVPEGTWFLRAVAIADNTDPEPWTRRTLLVGGDGPVTVDAGTVISARIELRPRRPTDLPILLALPDFEPQPADVTPAQAEFANAQTMRSA
ncbi:MAG: AraC family transcriptional regulator [Actinomycetota bacterium]|nr:AraC family transcriptional regulator [Actinomycetota bacterium]